MDCNIAALVGVLVAMVMIFNQVNGRLDRLHERMDRTQAETNARFDTLQSDVNRRFDTVLETILTFDRRVSKGALTHRAPKRSSSGLE